MFLRKTNPTLENDANLALLPKTGDVDINITTKTSGTPKDDTETKPKDYAEGVLEDHLQSTEMTETYETSIKVSDECDVQVDNSKTNDHKQSANKNSQNDNIHDNRTESSRTNKNKNENKERKTLISWSILKDIRFLSFVLATFCFTLPTSGLFLPALAKSKGMTGRFINLFRVYTIVIISSILVLVIIVLPFPKLSSTLSLALLSWFVYATSVLLYFICYA